MTNNKRLIEVAFPLKQASIDSVHEKNVRHGHISTLHIWPARRPLAACRAALIATLLPDPGDKEKRDEILQRLAGSLVKRTKSKKQANGQVEDVATEETEGGILHWGRESGPELDWFREEIRKAYGGRAPKVLDPFAGGGAIPLEAMRLGCEVTAADINPVAWFILKCTLEYPQQLAGQTRRLPEFALRDREFMAAYLKAQGLTPATIKRHLNELFPSSSTQKTESVSETESVYTQSGETIDLFGHDPIPSELLEADLAWLVRAWGLWVLKEARKSLARFYPTYAEYCSEKPYAKVPLAQDNAEHLKLVPLNELGEPQIELLNAGFAKDYLDDPKNPRWVAKPTVAYLWARTVKCKSCRAVLPLLKTRWLCKKENKRVLLTMTPDIERRGVIFGIDPAVKQSAGNAATKREHDKKFGAGTMSRSGASCPCCGTIMNKEDIRLHGCSGNLGAIMTAVVVDTLGGKEYRLPTMHEIEMITEADNTYANILAQITDLSIDESLLPASTRSISCHLYGINKFSDLFTNRQLLSLGTIGIAIHSAARLINSKSNQRAWNEAIQAYLSLSFDRLLSFNCVNVRWKIDAEAVVDAFSRFSISLLWDFSEPSSISDSAGGWIICNERICTALDTFKKMPAHIFSPSVQRRSAVSLFADGSFDVVMTDPPYYEAISYADLSDFFYTWLRGIYPNKIQEFEEKLTPKFGEIVQHIRTDKDRKVERQKYEDGMAEAFSTAYKLLNQNGRFVCVFAHKDPDAWETLVNAIIRAGFVVNGSWPIQTEMVSRQRAAATSTLSSSIWLVCKKRNPNAKAGWDAQVLQEMETNIVQKLRDFWDAGIHGPDFVWAATGPALESYSRYPAVRKASESGALMGVNEFLRHVRRIVVDFVVGRVLTGDAADNDTIDHALDNVTSYYLLHRYDFGMKDAPAGACILYAVSCGLSERELTDQYELLVRSGSSTADDETETDEEDGEASEPTGSGGQFKLNPWIKRKHKNLGQDSAGGRPSPLIDQIHKLMHLWQAGDVIHVNEYLDAKGLRRSRIFVQLLQALIELAPAGDNERATLERLSNHVKILGGRPQETLPFDGTGE